MRSDAIVGAITTLFAKEEVAVPQSLTSPITDPKALLSSSDAIYRFLFSVGFLSFNDSGRNLRIPNQLAYNVLSSFVLSSAAPPDRIEELRKVTHSFRGGDPGPLCTFIESRDFDILDSVRDSIGANELTFKVIIVIHLSWLACYLFDSERPAGAGYVFLYFMWFSPLNICAVLLIYLGSLKQSAEHRTPTFTTYFWSSKG